MVALRTSLLISSSPLASSPAPHPLPSPLPSALPSAPLGLSLTRGIVQDDSIYEFKVEESTGEWVHWRTQIIAWEPPLGMSVGEQFASIIVPTVDSMRNEYCLGLSASQLRGVLFIGGPGTAKTSTVLQYLGRADQMTTLTKKVSFSSATTPIIFQRQVEACVEKRQGRTFGPPGGKQMLVFVDDISMPEYNTWGDQITLEIVRQLMEQGGVSRKHNAPLDARSALLVVR